MTETITESFCERCGTRYEFQAPRLTTLRKTRGLIGGFRNYLTSQDALSDAMSDAMRTEEESLAAIQLDAFHSSFSFCIECRQYTCSNCWNGDAGRCRSCAPLPGTDDLAEHVIAPASNSTLPVAPHLADAVAASAEPVEAWPISDLAAQVKARPGADAFPAEPEPVPLVAETPDSAAAGSEPGTALVAVDAAGWIVVEARPEPPVRSPLRVVAWEEDEAIEPVEPEQEPEPEPMATDLEPEPEPVVAEVEPEPVAAEVQPESVVADEAASGPEPVVAKVEPGPEPVSAIPRMPPIHETILHFPTRQAPAPAQSDEDRAAAMAESPEVAARRAQLDNLGLGDPRRGPVAAQQRPLPYRSRGSGISSEELGRAAAVRNASFWAASAREVASATGHVGLQNCGQCGLSLSANARFCRRCGTPQARSA